MGKKKQEGAEGAPQRDPSKPLRTDKIFLPAPEAPVVVAAPMPAVVGSDILGGKAQGVSQSLHDRMVEMARRGDIPVTNPDARTKLNMKRPTFHGTPDWREAVQNGYIHPDL